MTKTQELALRKVLNMLRRWEQKHEDWVVTYVHTRSEMQDSDLVVRIELRHREPGAWRGLL